MRVRLDRRPFDAEQDRRDELAELSWLAIAFKAAPAMSTADDQAGGALVELRPLKPLAKWKRSKRAIDVKHSWDRRNRAAAAAKGLCSRCCNRPVVAGLRSCRACLKRAANRRKQLAARPGMCRNHVSVAALPGRSGCAVCLAKDAERVRVKRAAERKAA